MRGRGWKWSWSCRRWKRARDMMIQKWSERRDASRSAQECLEILMALRDQRYPDAAEQGLARVYRVIELDQS